MSKKVYQAIAHEIDRLDGAYYLHGDSLDALIDDFLPSGSGFDAVIILDYNAEEHFCDKYKLTVPYHCMSPEGFYDGWVEVEYTITPSFQDYNIKENWKGYRGKYKAIIGDYMIESIIDALEQDVDQRWNNIEEKNYYVRVDK